MAYSDLLTKYKASQGRVEKLTRQLEETETKIKAQVDEELTTQSELLVEMQSALAVEIGKVVRIVDARTAEGVPPATARYNKNDIVALIVQLKDDGLSFENIALKMNDEGNFKPKSASKFTGAAVNQIYRSVHPLARSSGDQI